MGTEPTLVRLLQYDQSLQELQRLVEQQVRSEEDDVVRALSRFLVVRSCGYLEQVSEECCRDYLRRTASPASASFGESWLGRGRSPKPGQLVELLGKFDPEWGEDLHLWLAEDDERRRRELEFLVDRRIKIAHGKNEGIGARKALDLAETAIEIAGWIRNKFEVP